MRQHGCSTCVSFSYPTTLLQLNAGTRFTIKREYKYYANNNKDIPAASSLNALVNDAESTYFFDGPWRKEAGSRQGDQFAARITHPHMHPCSGTYLYIKVLDPGDAETEV